MVGIPFFTNSLLLDPNDCCHCRLFSLCFRRLEDSGPKKRKKKAPATPESRNNLGGRCARDVDLLDSKSLLLEYSSLELLQYILYRGFVYHVLRGTQIPVEIVRTRVRNCFYVKHILPGRLLYDLWNVIRRNRGSFRALVSNFKHSSITVDQQTTCLTVPLY